MEGDRLALANRFFGTHIAGIAVTRRVLQHSKRKTHRRRVADRHVEEAVTLAKHCPGFRTELFHAAYRLLLLSVDEDSFNGQGLLELATQDAGQWGSLAHTAMDFASRLISAGVLPKSFATELLPKAILLPFKFESDSMEVKTGFGGPMLGFAALGSVIHRPVDSSATASLARAASKPLSEPCHTALRARAASEPLMRGSFKSNRTRSIPTVLHLQDDLQPYSSISFLGAVSFSNRTSGAMPVVDEAMDAHLAVPLCWMGDYYRSVGESVDCQVRAEQADKEWHRCLATAAIKRAMAKAFEPSIPASQEVIANAADVSHQPASPFASVGFKGRSRW